MKLKKVLLVIFVMVLNPSLSFAQQDFKLTKIDFNYRTIGPERSTIVGLDKGKLNRLGKIQSWGVAESYYESIPKWADDVELKYFVLMKGEQKGPVMLNGSIVYIYIEKGRDHVSTMYIPPQAILRYGEVLKMRVELWYNGILQDSMEWPKGAKKSQWWTKVKPIYGSMFNRFYTPFEHEYQGIEEVMKVEANN